MDFNDFMDWEERKSKVNDYVDSLISMCDYAREELREEKLEALREDVLDNIIE